MAVSVNPSLWGVTRYSGFTAAVQVEELSWHWAAEVSSGVAVQTFVASVVLLFMICFPFWVRFLQ
jgi:hypothetical protein